MAHKQNPSLSCLSQTLVFLLGNHSHAGLSQQHSCCPRRAGEHSQPHWGKDRAQDKGKGPVQAHGAAVGKKNIAGSHRPVLGCLSNTVNTPAVSQTPTMSVVVSAAQEVVSASSVLHFQAAGIGYRCKGAVKLNSVPPSKCRRGCG